MKYLMVVCVLLSLGGCVTNQLHFAAYSTEAELAAIKGRVVQADIVQVTGGEKCTRCKESSKIVWHAANYNVGLYEGFANVPVDDWTEFTKRAVDASPTSTLKTSVEIDRVFVKTWNSPDYYACEVSLTVDIAGAKYPGRSRLKLKQVGQSLIGDKLAALNAQVLDTIGLTVKAAYLNALTNYHKAH